MDFEIAEVFIPSSSNYALRKAAVGNSSCYGNDPAAAIMKNFCVDYLFKSVKEEEYAKDLIIIIQKTCSAGRLSLMKFISNSKSVLMIIPKNHRREGVKDADLANEELSAKKTLRMHCNIAENHLCFKVNLKTWKITRRGIL